MLASLPPEAFLGLVDPATLPEQPIEISDEEYRIARAREALPPPSAALNLHDIEVRFHSCRVTFRECIESDRKDLAKSVLSSTAWAYYRSAGDDENSAV
jgi:L-lactate dehydrogenase (cytochrome)